MQVQVKIPQKFKPLLTEHYRNKLYYGGRSGGKSYGFADCLLLLGRQKKLFIACLREVQNSIKDSVYKLLKDRAEYYQFDDYIFFEDRVENSITGTRIIFKGLKDQNAQNIKSLEGVNIAWIEEGQSISKKSWEILEPTIRAEGSEIWVSMNREEENDPIWKAIAAHPDENTYVCKVNYYENPFNSPEVYYSAEKCKKESPDDYEHIWLGSPVMQGNTKLFGAKEVRNAIEQKMDSSTSPLVVGVDVARFGDDKSVICFRKGRYCYKIDSYSHLSTVELANVIQNIIHNHQPRRVFIDIGGVGAGVYDTLIDRGMGEVVRGINFGERATYDDRYYNKRAEMWGLAKEWISGKLPVQIPDDEELFDDLCSVNKKYDNKGRLQLESKDDLKKRIGRSPDKADAFVLTFAEPVLDNGRVSMYGNGNVAIEQLFVDNSRSNVGW